ncbi:uncharacterized protein LOC131938480 [Physella acuta]|uniref:uncharacterized protein LOC131938480 n=1 Tax=Physella acuta TaxID=109671 RepID=UPI0027DD51CF|nr:uncharacterized protein LOC131938480 [Physella acuta]
MAPLNNVTGNLTQIISSLFIYTQIEARFLVYYHVEIVLSVVTVLTNITTLAVISCNSKLRILSNVFFASLAVCDVFQGIFGLIFNGIRIYGCVTNDWSDLGYAGSSALQFLWWFATIYSYGCLILITLERWIFIAHPLVYKRSWNVKVTVLGLLGFSVASFAGSYIAISRGLFSANIKYVFPVAHTVVSFVIFSAYVHIIVISYRQQRAILRLVVGPDYKTRTSCEETHYILCRNWKALKMSLIVFTTYFCTVSPWTYFQAFQTLTSPSELKAEVAQALNTITCVHFCSNFFVYASQNRDFYDVLKEYCTRLCKCRDRPNQMRTVSSGVMSMSTPDQLHM